MEKERLWGLNFRVEEAIADISQANRTAIDLLEDLGKEIKHLMEKEKKQ